MCPYFLNRDINGLFIISILDEQVVGFSKFEWVWASFSTRK